MTQPISELPEFVAGFFSDCSQVLFETAERVKERMSEPGQPVTYPIQWDSEKQRRAFFATDGFGEGIPYQRKGVYERSYAVERKPLGAQLHAPHPAGAIGGTPEGWQSRINRGRWNNLLIVLFDELAKIPDAISNKFTVRSGSHAE